MSTERAACALAAATAAVGLWAALDAGSGAGWLLLAIATALGATCLHLARSLRFAKAAAREARALADLLDECIAVTPNPVAIYDRDDRLVVWSKSYEKLHEGVFETLSQPIYYADLMRAVARRTLPEHEVEAHVAERVSDQRRNSGEWRDRQSASGTWYRVTKQLTPRDAVVGIAIDITAQKNREQELEAQTEVIAEISERIAKGTADESASLHEISDAIRRMVETVQDVQQRTREIRDASLQAQAEAAQVAATLGAAATSMQAIGEGAAESRSIVAVVEEIAQQVHLLSINASIEASAAGEQGKGFHVVATEVSSLAQRTKDATGRIRALIEGSVSEIARGGEHTAHSVDVLDRTMQNIEHVVAHIEEALARVDTQSQGIALVAERVEHVHEASGGNAQAARELVSRTVGNASR